MAFRNNPGAAGIVQVGSNLRILHYPPPPPKVTHESLFRVPPPSLKTPSSPVGAPVAVLTVANSNAL